jgi:hypothetical protein
MMIISCLPQIWRALGFLKHVGKEPSELPQSVEQNAPLVSVVSDVYQLGFADSLPGVFKPWTSISTANHPHRQRTKFRKNKAIGHRPHRPPFLSLIDKAYYHKQRLFLRQYQLGPSAKSIFTKSPRSSVAS